MVKRKMLVACALPGELRILRECMSRPCAWLATGLGGSRTYESLRQFFREQPEVLLVFTGTAGQLDPAVTLGQVVFPEAWSLEDGQRFLCDQVLVRLLREKGICIAGTGLTVRRPVLTSRRRERLFRSYGASVCDMEAALALKAASEWGVPALALKVVSDTRETGMRGFWRRFEGNLKQLAWSLDSLLGQLPPELTWSEH